MPFAAGCEAVNLCLARFLPSPVLARISYLSFEFRQAAEHRGLPSGVAVAAHGICQ
jgi:hypothetical protein